MFSAGNDSERFGNAAYFNIEIIAAVVVVVVVVAVVVVAGRKRESKKKKETDGNVHGTFVAHFRMTSA